MKWIKRMMCRFLEEDAAIRGRYREALYWGKRGEMFR